MRKTVWAYDLGGADQREAATCAPTRIESRGPKWTTGGANQAAKADRDASGAVARPSAAPRSTTQANTCSMPAPVLPERLTYGWALDLNTRRFLRPVDVRQGLRVDIVSDCPGRLEEIARTDPVTSCAADSTSSARPTANWPSISIGSTRAVTVLSLGSAWRGLCSTASLEVKHALDYKLSTSWRGLESILRPTQQRSQSSYLPIVQQCRAPVL